MKSMKGKTHAIFECLDCGKRWEGYINARQLARKHAEKHKHNVRGEVGKVIYYYGAME